MSQNPFGDEGGFDLNALMQQAQQMQEQLLEAQSGLEQEEVVGTVAGGAVSVTISGAGDLRGVEIRAGEIDGSDPDDLSDLGDLIVAAWRDAKARADALAAERLGPLTGGLGGGFGGGFDSTGEPAVEAAEGEDPQRPGSPFGFGG